MSSRRRETRFEAEEATLHTLLAEVDGTGYRVPEYQRPYSWQEDEVERLLLSCLEGFYRLAETNPAENTFLGTLILIGVDAEQEFKGQSFDVVDGQQRLITLVLTCCVVIKELLDGESFLALEDCDTEVKDWLKDEINQRKIEFLSLISGRQSPKPGQHHSYPRIIRGNEIRGAETSKAEYFSCLAKFINEVSKIVNSEGSSSVWPEISDFLTERQEALVSGDQQIVRNYETIKRILSEYLDRSNDEYAQVQNSSLRKNAMKNLLTDKLEDRFNSGERDENKIRGAVDRLLNKAIDSESTNRILRLLLFSSYIAKCIILIRIEAPGEDYAFDIFDSLNTTGLPLTALETLKPLVIQDIRERNENYYGSNYEICFNRISERINQLEGQDLQRKEQIALIVSLALYWEGKKLGEDLKSQRQYLRDTYRSIDKSKKETFIESIDQFSEFRSLHWRKGDTISNLSVDSRTKLAMRFILDMRTTLALPIIGRYWIARNQNPDLDANYRQAIGAVAFFLAVWRAQTVTTKGIDNAFRSLMCNPAEDGSPPLCTGLGFENEIWSIKTLKQELKKQLADHNKIDVQNLNPPKNWLAGVADADIGTKRTLAKMLVLAAAHNTESDGKGYWKDTGVAVEDNNDYLNYETWVDARYDTLEHVAPQVDNEDPDGWDSRIYQVGRHVHKLGNLVLLPASINSKLQNKAWSKKKAMYGALVASNRDSLKEFFDDTKSKDRKDYEQIRKMRRIYLLDFAKKVPTWDLEFIDKRSKRMAQHAWESLYKNFFDYGSEDTTDNSD